MDRAIYLSRKETADRKANGQLKKAALRRLAESNKELFDIVENLKRAFYTSPKWYGVALASRPLNKKGRRVFHVTNF